MRNIDSKSRPRTQFRFKYLAFRIRLLRLGGSLTTFSTVSVKSRHFAVQSPCLLYPRKRTLALHLRMSAKGQKRTFTPQFVVKTASLVLVSRLYNQGGDDAEKGGAGGGADSDSLNRTGSATAM